MFRFKRLKTGRIVYKNQVFWKWRRYTINYWRRKGVLVRKGYWHRRDHIVKLFNRNCMSGKKYKALANFLKALHLIHVFVSCYGWRTRFIDKWKIRRYPFFSFDNFFFWNRPFYSKRIRIRKKQRNKFIEYHVFEEKMPLELIKWFWLLTFSQPFKKVYQRYAFILLEFIFFTDNNMFRNLIRRLRKPGISDFDRLRKPIRKYRTRAQKMKKSYLGQINL